MASNSNGHLEDSVISTLYASTAEEFKLATDMHALFNRASLGPTFGFPSSPLDIQLRNTVFTFSGPEASHCSSANAKSGSIVNIKYRHENFLIKLPIDLIRKVVWTEVQF